VNSERALVEQAMKGRFTHGSEDSGEDVWPPTAARIRAARLRAGLSVDDLARYIGVNTDSCHDLEFHDDEVFKTVSLEELGALCRALKIRPASLLLGEDGDRISGSVTFEQISTAVRQRIAEELTTADEWGDAVGWDVGPILSDPAALAQFNVEGVFDICTAVGLDWAAALPKISDEFGS
jgi:transcriptional regulator with XRE-family HTH domain